MKIAITGTRGIPNQYGGFEQFAMHLSLGLVASGNSVTVYNPSWHSNKDSTYQGVNILHKKQTEKWFGSGSNLLYDLRCLRDAISKKPDVILECGYASAAPWYPFLKRGKIILLTHMDGMEWQREKWGYLTRKFFRKAERKAVIYSDAVVCDHPEIVDYYQDTYSIKPEMISYGADIREDWDPLVLKENILEPGNFMLLIARLEPENNIRMIIEGFLGSETREKLVVVGDYSGKYGRSVYQDFKQNTRLLFTGGIFDKLTLDHLRHYSKASFHGHSVGGTNPSLLEAMAAGCWVIAHDNPYNKWVLGDNAEYFNSSKEIGDLLSGLDSMKESSGNKIRKNLERIRENFQWESIVRQYEELFKSLM